MPNIALAAPALKSTRFLEFISASEAFSLLVVGAGMFISLAKDSIEGPLPFKFASFIP